MTKSVKDTLEQRVSCRRYERIPLTEEQRQTIYATIRNTPTSFNSENFTVIEVTDQDMKERLYEIVGQKQIKTCATFFVFCMDFNKVKIAAQAKGVDMPAVYDCIDGVMDGTINTSLALMSTIVAAESMGLGTCAIGYARTADQDAVAEALRLPDHVAVICGLAIGVPREHNDHKPKQPDSLLIHSNVYRDSSDPAFKDEILAFDKEVTQYNETRAGGASTNDWAIHMTDYYREMVKLPMREVLRRRGFNV